MCSKIKVAPEESGNGNLAMPSIALHQDYMEDLRHIFKEQAALSLLLVDGSVLSCIAQRYGHRVYHRVQEQMARILLNLRGVELRKGDFITTLDPASDQYLIFLSPKRTERPFGPSDLENCAERLTQVLSAEVARLVAPYLRTVPKVPIGYAFGLHYPQVQEKHMVSQLIEEARLMARYRQFRHLTRSREKLQELIYKGVIHTVFQPILHLNERMIVGYEALSRGPEGTEFERPDVLFEAATEAGLCTELDRLCRYKAIAHAEKIPVHARLFLNCFPATVYQWDFEQDTLIRLLAGLGLSPEDVVLEISEREVIENYGLFSESVDCLTALGFSLAVDDVGSGYSSLELVAQLKPAFFKLDLSLVRGIHHQPIKQALIKALTGLAEQLNARVIAEGIETQEELEALLGLGVTLGQGYLLGRPKAEFLAVSHLVEER